MLYPIELLARVLRRNASIHCNGLLREVEILQAMNLVTHRERYSPVNEKKSTMDRLKGKRALITGGTTDSRLD